MKIDPVTMLFSDLMEEEASSLQESVEALVLKGEITRQLHAFHDVWRDGVALNQSHSELTLTTAFPQRALISLLHHWRTQRLARE